MTRRSAGALAIAAALLAVSAAPASARWYGSLLRGVPNANYGCESALVLAPLGGVQLAPTNQVARFHGADVHRMYERLPS